MKLKKYWVYLFIFFCSCNLLESARKKKEITRKYSERHIRCGYPIIYKTDTFKASKGFPLVPMMSFSMRPLLWNDLNFYFVDYNNLRVGIYRYQIGFQKIETIGTFEIKEDTLTLFESLPIEYIDSLADEVANTYYTDCYNLRFSPMQSIAKSKAASLKERRNPLFCFQVPHTQYLIRKEHICYADGRDKCRNTTHYHDQRQADFYHLTLISKDSIKYVLPTQEKFERKVQKTWYSYKEACEHISKHEKAIKSENWVQTSRGDFEYNLHGYTREPNLSYAIDFQVDTFSWSGRLTGTCTPPTNQEIYNLLLKYTKTKAR